MVPKTDIKKGRPEDAVFGGDEGKHLSSSAPPVLITEEIAALAASMGLTTSTGTAAYEPDAFLAAIKRSRATLIQIRKELAEQNTSLGKRAAELEAREAAVTFREKRVAAHEALLELDAPQPKRRRWWLGWTN